MANLIKVSSPYVYQKMERVDTSAGRVYKSDKNGQMPSVTTILSATKDKASLEAWAARVGAEEAERIKRDAAHVGTAMHQVMESFIAGEPLPVAEDWLQMRGYEMGHTLINRFFHNIDEIWGSEVPLYYPEKYAGTTDLVAVYRGKEAIVDFKQSIKPKRHEWIGDYFHQLAAYAMAHDIVHGTKINYGVVLVAVQDGTTQEFTTAGHEFERYKKEWMERVEAYHRKVESNGNSL